MTTQLVTGGENTGLLLKGALAGRPGGSLGHIGHTPGRSLSGIPLVSQALDICLASWLLVRSDHTLV